MESVTYSVDGDRDSVLSELQDMYRFYIVNPPDQPGVKYSFWHLGDGGEFPVMELSTGNFTTYRSRSQSVGEGIEPTPEFFDLIGLAFHEAMCFMPPEYFGTGKFTKTAQSVYDGKVRGYEFWGAKSVVYWLCQPEGEHVPELEPLVEWAGDHSEFDVPASTNTH